MNVNTGDRHRHSCEALDRAGAGLAGGSLCRAWCFQPAALRNEVARHLALAAVIPRRPLGSRSDGGALLRPRNPLVLSLLVLWRRRTRRYRRACSLSGQRPVSPPFSFDFQDVASGSVLLVSRSLSGQNLLPRLLQTIDVDGPSRKCIDNSDVILIAACARGPEQTSRTVSVISVEVERSAAEARNAALIKRPLPIREFLIGQHIALACLRPA
jgi:hypothetical protein